MTRDQTKTDEANLEFMESAKRLLTNYTLNEVNIVEELKELYTNVEEAQLIDRLIENLLKQYTIGEFVSKVFSKYPILKCIDSDDSFDRTFYWNSKFLKSLSSKQILNILDNFELEV